MTVTTTLSIPKVRHTPLLRTGAVAGVSASLATVAVAASGHAAGISLDVGGQAIPLVGFAELTFVLTMVGVAIAVGIRRFAARSRGTFVLMALALTALSIVPDALADAHTSTRVLLACTHLVAAAIVIPTLASRLSD